MGAKLLTMTAVAALILLFGCAGISQPPAAQQQLPAQNAPLYSADSGHAVHDTNVTSVDEQSTLGNGQEAENGLTACTAISEKQERLSCIAQWCGSEARDYKKCYNLTNDDDRFGCLNKCNPNPNS